MRSRAPSLTLSALALLVGATSCNGTEHVNRDVGSVHLDQRKTDALYPLKVLDRNPIPPGFLPKFTERCVL